MKKKVFISLILLLSLIFSSCSKPAETKVGKVKAMETNAEIQVLDDQSDFIAYFEQRLLELDSKWDPKNTESEIAKFNYTRSSSHLSEESVKLLSECIALSKKTDGLLDITLYPMTRLWGFETEEPKKPESLLVSLLVTKCGMDTITMNGNEFTLEQYTMLDPSAVSKGLAADLIAKELEEKGCSAAMLTIGDHIRTFGENRGNKNWSVSLSDPFEKAESFATVKIGGGFSVSTKGAFQHYFIEDGERYCNIFNPKNGKPVDNDLLSATIVSKSGITADAYATACFIMGAKDAEKFYRSNDGFELILVLKDGEVRVSEGLADSFELSNENKDYKVIKKSK